MSDKTGFETKRIEVTGPVTNEVHSKKWDPVGGRYQPEVNAGDNVNRVIAGAVTTATTGTTVSLGNWTAGSRDEAYYDLETFGDFGGTSAASAGIGFIQIDQAGTVLAQYYLDLSTSASNQVTPRYRHITTPSQNEPLFRIQAGTVCNVKWVSITTTNATVHATLTADRLSFANQTAPVGIV